MRNWARMFPDVSNFMKDAKNVTITYLKVNNYRFLSCLSCVCIAVFMCVGTCAHRTPVHAEIRGQP